MCFVCVIARCSNVLWLRSRRQSLFVCIFCIGQWTAAKVYSRAMDIKSRERRLQVYRPESVCVLCVGARSCGGTTIVPFHVWCGVALCEKCTYFDAFLLVEFRLELVVKPSTSAPIDIWSLCFIYIVSKPFPYIFWKVIIICRGDHYSKGHNN